MSHLYLSSSRRPGSLRVAVIGPLERQTSAAFTKGLSMMLRECDTVPMNVVVNLRCCTAMDADGVIALAGIRDAVAAQGGTFQLEDVPPLLEYVVHHATDNVGSNPGLGLPTMRKGSPPV